MTLKCRKLHYNIEQTGNDNTWTYQVEVVILIYHQIVLTNLQVNL